MKCCETKPLFLRSQVVKLEVLIAKANKNLQLSRTNQVVFMIGQGNLVQQEEKIDFLYSRDFLSLVRFQKA